MLQPTWYLKRLSRMSAPEIALRARRLVGEQLQRGTLALPKPVPAPLLQETPAAIFPRAIDSAPYLEAADRLLDGRWDLFRHRGLPLGMPPEWNREPTSGRRVPLRYGPGIDYRNTRLVGNIKYLWEPNRHLELVTLAQAWWLSGEQRYLDGVGTLIDSWLTQCPHLKGPNWCSALELGIRLINWSLAWEIIGGARSELFAGEAGEALRHRWLECIYRHVQFITTRLSLYSSANNHLIGEAAGIFVATLTWPYWPEMQRWREQSRDLLIEQALQQNAPDGVNREQAVAYQQFVLDFLLIAALRAERAGEPLPTPIMERIASVLEFVAAIMDVAGNVPMIGDADDGYVTRLDPRPDFCPFRSQLATGAVLFGREDFAAKAGPLDDRTRWLLSGRINGWAKRPSRPPQAPVRRAFPEGGYYVLGCDFETDQEIRVVADVGPLGYLSIAAHGHADALAFTLSVGGNEVLVDPGTYAYHTQRYWRDYFRGTRAHNTVCIDGEDQSLSGGRFLWLTHADGKPIHWRPGSELDDLAGYHEGYQRLPDPVVHHRRWRLFKRPQRLIVDDRVECRGEHRVERYWHFAESCEVVSEGQVLFVRCGDRSVQFTPLQPVTVRLHRGEIAGPAGWISRRFDQRTPTTTVVWESRVQGTTLLQTAIDCGVSCR